MEIVTGNFVAPLSMDIQQEFNRFSALLKDVAPNIRLVKNIQGTGGLVTISDLIAYQIGWGRLLCNWYYSGKKRIMPVMPGCGFTTWDYVGLACIFYKKYHYDGAQEQERQFLEIVQRIISIVEAEFATGNLDKTGVWQWCTLASGKQWPLSKWIRINTVAPYKRAISLIKACLKNNKEENY